MSVQTTQPTHPGWKFWLLWMLGTILGMASMVLSIPFQMILIAALGSDAIPPPWTTTQTALIMVFKGAQGGVMGLGIGLGQWLVLRKYLKQTSMWIFATGFAFFLEGAFRWSLPYDTPSEQIFVLTTLGSGIFLGLSQWFVLHGHIPNAGWWMAINLAGSVVALVIHTLSNSAQFSIESGLGMVFFAISMLLPFTVAGAGMVWLLQPHSPASQAAVG